MFITQRPSRVGLVWVALEQGNTGQWRWQLPRAGFGLFWPQVQANEDLSRGGRLPQAIVTKAEKAFLARAMSSLRTVSCWQQLGLGVWLLSPQGTLGLGLLLSRHLQSREGCRKVPGSLRRSPQTRKEASGSPKVRQGNREGHLGGQTGSCVSPPRKPGPRSIGSLEGRPGREASAGALVATGKAV